MPPLLRIGPAVGSEALSGPTVPSEIAVFGRAAILWGERWQTSLAAALTAGLGRAEVAGCPLAAGLQSGKLGWFDGSAPWSSRLTVGEAVGWSAGLLGLSKRAALRALPKQVERLGVPWGPPRLRARLAQLGAAERGWLRLATALLGQPESLVVCNPFDALEGSARQVMVEALRRLLGEGMNWVVVSEARGAEPEWTALEQLADDTLWLGRGSALWQRSQHTSCSGFSVRVCGSAQVLSESLCSAGYRARVALDSPPGHVVVVDPERLGANLLLRRLLSLEMELLEISPLAEVS